MLRRGQLEIVGRLTEASNATFLCQIDSVRAVYKPTRGERPLDDFPIGTLAQREAAAYLLSEATGWEVMPPTVLRDGPYGQGMVQLWIETDPDSDVVEMIVTDDPRLRAICVFDVLANNADRKGGHLLPVAGGHVYGVDHGICFAVEPKLRTVLWAWRGQKLAQAEMEVVRGVCDQVEGELGLRLTELLSADEVRATSLRAKNLLKVGRFPQPDPNRPALPWPPF
ncbi:MAG: SCO1664 family protein [Chloroflexota bacterium]